MADHLREQILDAVGAALAAIPSSPTVTRATAYPQVLPSINLLQGADRLLDEAVVDAIAHELELALVVAVADTEGLVDQAFNALEAEIYAALAGVTLAGLVDLYWQSTSVPEIAPDASEADGVASVATITWVAWYRHAPGDVSIPA